MDDVRRIADAVLYEGYVLWPYRAGALKNQRRWTFGGVYPPAHSVRHPDDRAVARAQVLVEGGEDAEVDVQVRFLHVVRRELRDAGGRGVPELVAGGRRHVAWDEAAEREQGRGPVAIPAGRDVERLDGGSVIRSWEALEGLVSVQREPARAGLQRVTVTIANTTPFDGPREEALRRTFCSAHAVLRVRGGAFVSSTDPAAAGCVSEGLWPVLVGEPGSRDTMLASPIILEEHPRIAPESPGDLFDGGEIDQLLTLGILSMTDAEKEEMRACDPRTREILERTEALTPEQLMALHGTVRRPGAWEELERRAPASVQVGDAEVRPGSRVRMRPRAGGDVFDIALEGREGVVESIEQDMEDAIRLAVVVDDDPGRDLGGRRRPGHRFFFAPDEVEPVAQAGAKAAGPRILVAGIGNIFLADDGFGVALAGRLERLELPAGVDVVDFGIRGMDLAYALSGYDAVLLLDAARRGERPGTLSVIEPQLEDTDAVPEAHGMDPATVLALARSLGDVPPRTLVLACEPLVVMTGEEDEIRAELSAPVHAALDAAVPVAQELIAQLIATQATEVRPA